MKEKSEYRVIKYTTKYYPDYYEVHKVSYYSSINDIIGINPYGTVPTGGTLEELKEDIKSISEASNKPIIDFKTKREIHE